MFYSFFYQNFLRLLAKEFESHLLVALLAESGTHGLLCMLIQF